MRERRLLGGGRRVLDVGCHTGGLLARMPADDERIGVDVDERSAGACRRRASRHPLRAQRVRECRARRAGRHVHDVPRARAPAAARRRAAATGGARGRGRPARRRGPDRRERREQRRLAVLQPVPHDPLHARRAAARAARGRLVDRRLGGAGGLQRLPRGRRDRRRRAAAATGRRPGRLRPLPRRLARERRARRGGARHGRRPALPDLGRRQPHRDALPRDVVLPHGARARVPARRPRPGEDRRDVARHPDRRARRGRRPEVPLVVSSYQGQPEIVAEARARGVDRDRRACTTRSRFTESRS